MSGGGGKGGSQSSKVEIPPWAEAAMQENLRKAEQFGEIGYMPYYGPSVAAFTPMQETAMQSAYDAGAAYGLAPRGGNALAGIPQAQEFAGGIRGYSSGDLFDQAVAELAARRPGQAEAYNRMFINPTQEGGYNPRDPSTWGQYYPFNFRGF